MTTHDDTRGEASPGARGQGRPLPKRHKRHAREEVGEQATGPRPRWNVEFGYSFSCLVPPTEEPYTIDTQGSGEVLTSPPEG